MQNPRVNTKRDYSNQLLADHALAHLAWLAWWANALTQWYAD